MRSTQREPIGDRFNRLAARLTEALGSVTALVLSVIVVLVWAVTGPIFHFSDTWQLVINTATTVVTFWMVFVIQNSANRDAKAVQLKLDEIIRATKGARNEMITLERAPQSIVTRTADELAAVARRAARGRTRGHARGHAAGHAPDQRGTSSEA